MLTPIRYAGTNPTSDKTEYRPPIKCLCSIKEDYIFLKSCLKIFFSLCNNYYIFALYFNIFSAKKFDIVSIVFPDFEIIIKR